MYTHAHTYIHTYIHTYKHTNIQTYKQDYSTQSKFFMVLRTVWYAFSSTTTTYIRYPEHTVLHYTDIYTIVASIKLQRNYVLSHVYVGLR